MDSRNHNLIFSDQDFELTKKDNKLILTFGTKKSQEKLDLTRLFAKTCEKWMHLSDDDFNEQGFGGIFDGTMTAEFHYESEYMIQEIDGKNGLETYITDKTDPDIDSFKISLYQEDNLLLELDIVDQLTEAEKDKIATFLLDKSDSMYSGVKVID
jgi:hypothetical protein